MESFLHNLDLDLPGDSLPYASAFHLLVPSQRESKFGQ